MLVTRNQLLSQKIISWHKKSSLVTRNQFLPQEIHSYHKKSILVKRNQFLWSHILWLNYFINTQQRVKPTKKFAWMLTFRGNLVPRFPGNSPPWYMVYISHVYLRRILGKSQAYLRYIPGVFQV